MKITNWDKWQSFRKDRGTPSWIKVHRNLLSNPEWVSLSDKEKGQLVSIWLLAADKSGEVPDSPNLIMRMAMLDSEPNTTKFIELGFMVTTCQPSGNHVVDNVTHKSREEERREEDKTLMSVKPDDVIHILNYLNAKRASNYKPTQANKRLISARLKEGFSLEDLKRVIDNKIIEWGNSRKMEKYIRPSTLFNAEKFSQYAGEPDQDKDDGDITKPPSWMSRDDSIEGECSHG